MYALKCCQGFKGLAGLRHGARLATSFAKSVARTQLLQIGLLLVQAVLSAAQAGALSSVPGPDADRARLARRTAGDSSPDALLRDT